MVSQILIVLLAVDAAFVAYGLYRKKNRWVWVVTYWIILTVKNLCDLMKW